MPKGPKLKLRTFRLSDDTMHKLLGIVVYHRRKWREAGLIADAMSKANGTELIRRLIVAGKRWRIWFCCNERNAELAGLRRSPAGSDPD